MKILLLGGSGMIGSKLQPILQSMGHEVKVASTKSGVNVLTGEGVAKAMEGVNVVVDVLNTQTFDPETVLKFYTTSNSHVLPAEAAAGVQHHVALSVVGCDRSANGYLQAKYAQERGITAAGIPYTIVRATQFMEFIGFIADANTGADGVTRVSSIMMQPIAADDVAKELARIAVSHPVNGVIQIAGPEKLRLNELAAMHYQANNINRQVVVDESTGYFGAPADDKSLVPLGDAVLTSITFSQWLQEHKDKKQNEEKRSM